ncbi:MAG: amidase [Actinomycetota bacterium]|nr:amidase [Actinomycetota bacterium]
MDAGLGVVLAAVDAELHDLDATGQAELVSRGEIKALELVEHAIERIERLNPQVNAVIHPLFDKALDAAASGPPTGPFGGVPMVVKDLDGHTAGDRFHCGMRFLKELDWTEPDDSYSHAKLRDAGFVFVGKTNCPELGLIPTTEPEAYGPTHNPWKLGYSPGGSSGGTAAAVASRMVAAGTAGDGGGSIRVPASECGLVGLKPTRGRVSLGPDQGEAWHGFVVRGALTRSVRDCAGLLDAMSGAMPGDPYSAPPFARPLVDEVGADPGSLKIGLRTSAFGNATPTDPSCAAAAEGTAKLLEELGHRVEEASPAELDDQVLPAHIVAVIATWTRYELDFWSAKTGKRITEADVEPGTWSFAEMAASITGPQYVNAIESIHLAARRGATWWNDFDLLLTPTIPEPPPPHGEWVPTEDNPLRGLMKSSAIVNLVAPFNVTGQPAISVPSTIHDGLPIGVQLVAAYGREDLLIRIASQIETARPWAQETPVVY